ncbi:MAG: TRAP transporter large permease [Rhodospirillaceae bacterium]|nr:TRAP transporter large permease [Rhodospirillaceae bacterium]
MSAAAMALLMLGLLLFGNIPVAFAFGIASTLYILTNDLPVALTIQRTFYGIHDFTLLAIPLFVLAGNVMNISGVTIRILRFANALVGHTRGGLANANVVASIIFSGMSGSALADAGGLGTVEIEAMQRGGYPKKFAVGVTGSSATIGPIIPPSIPLVIYGAIAEVSVGALFLAGLLPGLLMGLCLMVYVSWQARKLLIEKQPTPTLRILVKATWEALPAVFTPVIILGGIGTGIFTPTEAAAVTVLYGLVLGAIYRELSVKKLAYALSETFKTTSSILFILASAAIFAWALAHSNVSRDVGGFLISMTGDPLVFLLVMNVVFLVLGMVLDTLSIQIITLPILIPLLAVLGIDPVHFGIVMTLNLMIGLFTPPVGTGLYILRDVSGLTFEEVTAAVLRPLIPLLFALFIVTYAPDISLFLPRLLGYAA